MSSGNIVLVENFEFIDWDLKVLDYTYDYFLFHILEHVFLKQHLQY